VLLIKQNLLTPLHIVSPFRSFLIMRKQKEPLRSSIENRMRMKVDSDNHLGNSRMHAT